MKKTKKCLLSLLTVTAMFSSLALFASCDEEHEHSYESTVTKAATCMEDGVMTYTCTECDDTYTEAISATGHTYVDGVCSVCGEAEEQVGGELAYTLSEDGTYYIVSGIGDCTDTDIIIPSEYNGLPVTAIGEYAFNYKYSFTSVIIPDSVTSIGEGAFAGCFQLTSITIPDSVTNIENFTFSECQKLTSITIPDSVTSIGRGAFSSCISLTSVTIPDSVTIIGSSAFYSCDGLTSITILDSVTSIEYNTFSRCTNLTSVTIGSGVTSIGMDAFSFCTNLTSITIPDSVASVRENAFRGCSNLASVTIGNNVTSIGSTVFYNTAYYNDSSNWKDGVLYLTATDNVTKYLLEVDTSLSGAYTVAAGTKVIADDAFIWCISLTDVTISDSVTSIGNHAFEYCSNLTSITIPDSATSIGRYAFCGCDSLTSVTFEDATTWYYTSNYDYTDGTQIDVSDPGTVAGYLRDTYTEYYWYKA